MQKICIHNRLLFFVLTLVLPCSPRAGSTRDLPVSFEQFIVIDSKEHECKPNWIFLIYMYDQFSIHHQFDVVHVYTLLGRKFSFSLKSFEKWSCQSYFRNSDLWNTIDNFIDNIVILKSYCWVEVLYDSISLRHGCTRRLSLSIVYRIMSFILVRYYTAILVYDHR